ncbi:MAG: hypothetical protein COB12_04465 [Flavobacterium sp.]|nr:MAG: hypothetical protein COB12_04465 [Flavobacterium sp.]
MYLYVNYTFKHLDCEYEINSYAFIIAIVLSSKIIHFSPIKNKYVLKSIIMENKLYDILQKFILNNSFIVNTDDFKLQLISNPSFPSIKAISDTLDYFGIENIVANVPKDALDQLPEYFLAVIEEDNAKSIAQVQNKNNYLKLFVEDGTKKKVSVDEFKEIWNGTIIAIEKNNSPSTNKSISLKKLTLPLLLIGLATLTFLLFNKNIQTIIYTVFTLIGIFISYFIIRESFGIQDKSTSKICNSTENNTSCSDVINNKTSKLFGLISLSDASIIYFTSQLLIIGILGFNTSFFIVLSIISIPIIFYSLYSQAFIIKKWCPLCLGIVSILISQIVVSFISPTSINFNLLFFIKSFAIIASMYLIWIISKKMISKALKLEPLKVEYFKFKRNENLFLTLLTKEKRKTETFIEASSRITFGNPDAKFEIVSVTNPLCGFCTKAFESYDSLLKTFDNKLKLTVVFNVSSENTENPATQISQRIIEIYQLNKEDAYKALKNWFEIKDVDKWQEAYNKPTMLSNYESLNSHYNWCLENDISYTPATLIGNYFFPKEYEVKDLSLFIDFLIEAQNKKIKKEPSIH